MKRYIESTLAIGFLFLGGLIYLLYRNDSLLMFRWLDTVYADGVVATMRDYSVIYKKHLPEWFIFSLPQALWLYSGIVGMNCIWWKNRNKSCFWISIFFAIAIGMELSQATGYIPGNYDHVDAALLILALAAGLYTNGIFNQEGNGHEEI